MKVFVSIKQAGNRKDFLIKKEFNLLTNPGNLKELLTEIIYINVTEFNTKPSEPSIIKFLTKNEIEEQAQTGKLGFRRKYNDKKAEVTEATKTALLAFTDGLFRVFHEDVEISGLDEPLELKEGDVFTFIKFTMLAGRMW